jgi:hypothetical protein
MAIIGFSFTKVFGEKRAPIHGQVSVNNNVAIVDVSDANITMAQSKKGVKVHFSYDSKYEPGIGILQFEGDVVLLEDAKFAEEILASWKESKTVPKGLMMGLLNHVLERANIQALILSRDLGLPAPIPLPKVNVQAPPAPEQKAQPKAAVKPKAKKK